MENITGRDVDKIALQEFSHVVNDFYLKVKQEKNKKWIIVIPDFAEIKINMWRLWCKALGEKATDDDRESDRVALIRTFLITQSIITNIIIILNFIFTHFSK